MIEILTDNTSDIGATHTKKLLKAQRQAESKTGSAKSSSTSKAKWKKSTYANDFYRFDQEEDKPWGRSLPGYARRSKEYNAQGGAAMRVLTELATVLKADKTMCMAGSYIAKRTNMKPHTVYRALKELCGNIDRKESIANPEKALLERVRIGMGGEKMSYGLASKYRLKEQHELTY